jgi:hypothetical protein
MKLLIILTFAFTLLTRAFAQMPVPYGMPITLENAKKVAAPALAEAAKNNWTMAVAVVDPGGNLVYYEKMDNTQLGKAPPLRLTKRALRLSSSAPQKPCRMRWRPAETAFAFSRFKVLCQWRGESRLL